jgi:hypothetical protein
MLDLGALPSVEPGFYFDVVLSKTVHLHALIQVL